MNYGEKMRISLMLFCRKLFKFVIKWQLSFAHLHVQMILLTAMLSNTNNRLKVEWEDRSFKSSLM